MDERSARVARRLEPWLIVATLLVIPVLILESVDVGRPWGTVAAIGDWAIWLAFLAELVLMLAVVPRRWEWIRTHPLDVAIVVLTPPFAGALLQTVRAVRLVRLLRLTRLARVASLTRTVFSLAGVRFAAFAAFVTIIAGGQAFAATENITTSRGIYWAVTTMTTVGYGDVTPTTGTSELIAVAVMLVGIGFVAILTGAVAERFIEPRDERDQADVHRQLQEIADRLAAIERALSARPDDAGSRPRLAS